MKANYVSYVPAMAVAYTDRLVYSALAVDATARHRGAAQQNGDHGIARICR